MCKRALFVACALSLAACAQQEIEKDRPISSPGWQVTEAVHHDTSPPLSEMTPALWVTRFKDPAARSPEQQDPRIDDEGIPKGKQKKPLRRLPSGVSNGPDPVVQAAAGAPTSLAAPASGGDFAGISDGVAGFTVMYAPPDTVGDVGPSHYVQAVNTSFAVYSKAGSLLYGPVPTNTLWSGFGGGCEANNDGDATVRYDSLAGRWIIAQFAVSTTPYLQCVAVSATGDPMGSYYRYAFSYNNFNDYPKLAVWPDAYYTTFNMFGAVSFLGAKVCAYDRGRMLQGLSATQQCFDTSSSYGGLLAADVDGTMSPPAGVPSYVMSFTSNSLKLWRFKVDWANPALTTVTGPISVAGVAAFTAACNGGGTCIPQPGTKQKLDSLGDRLMYRLAYRNFGTHESLVVNHSVTTSSRTGIRWYEVRDPGGTPTVYQQGTYSPDSHHRWMGSAAMDGNGNIAIGYSVSSSTLKPSIRYTGRLATDPLGTMQAETTMLTGTGSQLRTLDRWGDYSSLTVDPNDDCTFWYTTEYLTTNGTFNWSTRIGSFKFASCSVAPPPPGEFTLSASPGTASVSQGGSASYTVTVTDTSGSMGTVALSVSGLPAGATASFSPPSLSATGTSALGVATDATTPTGTYTLTITGTGTSVTHTATVSLTVTVPNVVANGGFETGTFASWTTSGVMAPTIISSAHSGSYAGRLGSTTTWFNGDSIIDQTLTVPAAGATLSFWYRDWCPDTITYDQLKVLIRSTSGSTLATVMNICTNYGAWTYKSYSLNPWAGLTIVLRFLVHDDGWPYDQSAMDVDDVTVQ